MSHLCVFFYRSVASHRDWKVGPAELDDASLDPTTPSRPSYSRIFSLKSPSKFLAAVPQFKREDDGDDDDDDDEDEDEDEDEDKDKADDAVCDNYEQRLKQWQVDPKRTFQFVLLDETELAQRCKRGEDVTYRWTTRTTQSLLVPRAVTATDDQPYSINGWYG